jgi:hypothetical protein
MGIGNAVFVQRPSRLCAVVSEAKRTNFSSSQVGKRKRVHHFFLRRIAEEPCGKDSSNGLREKAMALVYTPGNAQTVKIALTRLISGLLVTK